MNGFFSRPVIAILIAGALIAGVIWTLEPRMSGESHSHSHESGDSHADDSGYSHDGESGHDPADASGHAGDEKEVPRGPHGGWLFSSRGFQTEVTIYETGVPPQFRVYVSRASGEPIDPAEVLLKIELHRLGRTDVIGFQPAGDYLLGDQEVYEPHSFVAKVQAHWKGSTYDWEFSQIEARAEFTEASLRAAGIELDSAGPARLQDVLRLTGEIALNEEKVVHIVPRLDGVVKKVFKDMGDQVKKGELIAVLESRELADAKINYLAAVKQSELIQADLKREKLIYENTRQMLDLLEQKLEIDAIYARLKDLAIGENRERLLPAYARVQLARSVHQREKRLFDKGISSESEYLQALENVKSAEATYLALREKIAYDGDWGLRQKTKNAEMESLNLQTATQKLLALGLSRRQIKGLANERGQKFTEYELRSTLKGTVIKKHLTTGEAVKKDDDIFLLADLTDVWVNIDIPAREVKNVRLGQRVKVRGEHLDKEAEGTLTFLGSIIEENTRTVTARVVISNADRSWRPGTFVTVELVLKDREAPVAVRADAVQTMRGWSVVFVRYGNQFEARPLELGENDGTHVEVLKGLTEGEVYAAVNSFAVKAEIEKSGAAHSH